MADHGSRFKKHMRSYREVIRWAFQVVAVFLASLWTEPVWAQLQTRLPSQPNTSVQPPGDTASSTATPGPGPLTTLPSGGWSGSSLGPPTFDPYSTAPGSSLLPWSGSGTVPAAPFYGTGAATPSTGATVTSPLTGTAPGGASTAMGTIPPSLFPNGLGGWITPQGQIVGTPLRFLQGPRARHGWLIGDEGRELDVNETDVSVVLTFPEFLYSTQPLYIAPSFSLNLWEGPAGPDFPPGADLPGQTYAGYLDNFWQSDPTRLFGAEVGVRLGLWTDFDTLTTDSFRIQGLGLFRVRLTPTFTMKLGAAYLDRNKIKLVPAGGFLWEPNPQTRLEIIIPQPKFARYVTTLGNQDVWCYVTGEYGGNAWTIERFVDGGSDRFDYNDIRLIGGIEWGSSELFRERRRFGFIEVAWVTEREVIYVRRPEDSFTVRDTIMLRAGLGY